MKIRNGFVSNSSSSSFILAIGKVTDREKLEKFLEKHNINKYNWQILNVKDITTKSNFYHSVYITSKYITGEGFQGSVSIDKTLLQSDDNFFFLSIFNDEGDNTFRTDPDGCDLDYSIDLSFFNEDQQAVYDYLEENGLIHVDKTYGAGRNG